MIQQQTSEEDKKITTQFDTIHLIINTLLQLNASIYKILTLLATENFLTQLAL